MILKTLNPFKELNQASGKSSAELGQVKPVGENTSENPFAKLLSMEGLDLNKADLSNSENKTEIADLIKSIPEGKTVNDGDVAIEASAKNEFTKTFDKISNTEKTVSTKENEILKILNTEDKSSKSKTIMKTSDSLESVLGIIGKESKVAKESNNPTSELSISQQQTQLRQLNKITAKLSEGKQLTPKEEMALQIATQNNIGVNKKENGKQGIDQLKFNLDIASLNNAKKILSKNGAHQSYANGFSQQSNSLIKGPVSSELIENQKMIDKDGISNMHKSADQNVSFEIISNAGQETNQGDLKSAPKSNAPTIDLSHINVSSKEQLISEVSNYIQRSYVAGQDKLDVIVKHDELGEFRITAQRLDRGGDVSLEIQTKLENGHDFFSQNESELVKTLQNNGIKLSSLKIAQKSEFSLTMESGKSFSGDQSSDNNSSQRGNGNSSSESRQQGSFGSSSRQGQDRRRELWQEASQYRQQLAS